jgi:AcrR family transcriptional regulator
MATRWREAQKSRLKESLYETALRFFRAKGYDGTTVQQIAEEVGVAKGTFFNYFLSKEHVLAEWYRRVTRAALTDVSAREFPSTQDTILALADSLAERVAADPRLWDKKAKTTTALFFDEERALDDELLTFCFTQISAGKKRGDLVADLDASLFADMIVTVLTGTGQAWVVAGHGFDLREVARARVAFLFRGACVEGSPRRAQL